jgi:putative ABC transport system permease protein
MLISQNVFTALRGLMSNKLRSALTILGIVIGVAAVVALMAIGNGATSSITDQIASNGSNLLNVQAGRSQRPSPGEQMAHSYLTYKDYQALTKALTDVSAISAAYQSNYTVIAGTQSSSVSVIGATEDYLTVHSYTVEQGRGISANDRTKLSQVAVIGATTAEDMFPNESAVGKTLKINNVSYTVVGTLASKGSTGFDNTDDVVLIPLESGYSKLFGSNAIQNSEKVVSAIAVSASSADTIDSVSSQITFVLRHQHHLATSDDDDFSISNQAELLETMSSVSSTLTTFLGAIAFLSLLVGGIGIMNITLVSVSERTREIGLRKAIGAQGIHILFQFLVETMTLSVSGGVIGIILGASIAWIVTLLGLITAKITFSSISLAFLFAVAIGLFFGIYPAYRASRLQPMVALRSE